MATIGYQIGYNTFQSQLDVLQSDVAALESGEIMVQTAATFSALPSAAGLPDGTLAIVTNSFANGMASLWVVRDNQWVLPLEALPPTISFVCQIGGGAGELPEDVVVASAANGVLGVGWVLDADNSFARPAGIAVTPLDPDDLTLGANGAGLWRIAVELNYASPTPGSGILTRFFLQKDIGSGFTDLPNGELARLDQGSSTNVDGISQVGLVLNETLNAGDALRVVVRHNKGSSQTYTVNKFAVTLNQIAAQPT